MRAEADEMLHNIIVPCVSERGSPSLDLLQLVISAENFLTKS